MVSPEEITTKVNEVIAKYVDTSAITLNEVIDGSIVNRPTASNTNAIQGLVKRLNESSLKVTYIFFLITAVISELVLNRKMCSHILARAT